MKEMKLNNKDVGLAEDMAFALKNLIAIEDHSATSFGINNDEKWLKLINIIRKIRTKWINTLVKKEDSHIYCISKHLLASAEGMIEIGNRFNSTNQYSESKEAYNDAIILMELFLDYNEIKSEGEKSSA